MANGKPFETCNLPFDLLVCLVPHLTQALYNNVHEVTAYEVKGCINVIVDLEVEPSLQLDPAHEKATVLEQDIKQGLPEVCEVNIHLEPFMKNVEAVNAVQLTTAELESNLPSTTYVSSPPLTCHIPFFTHPIAAAEWGRLQPRRPC